jgi:hypothetical protein
MKIFLAFTIFYLMRTRDVSSTCIGINWKTQSCCANNIIPGYGLSCCGALGFNPTQKTCCNGYLRNGGSQGCCGSTAYDTKTQACCGSGGVYFLSSQTCCNSYVNNGKNLACCGTRGFNPTTHTCCSGVIFLGKKTTCVATIMRMIQICTHAVTAIAFMVNIQLAGMGSFYLEFASF